jgi:hypothetical protein
MFTFNQFLFLSFIAAHLVFPLVIFVVAVLSVERVEAQRQGKRRNK